jgi:hypothetical protein
MSYFDETGMGDMSGFRPGGRIGDEIVEVEGRVEHETPKAKLVEFTNGPKIWVPKSQIVTELPNGDTIIFHIKEWFAKKEKLV